MAITRSRQKKWNSLGADTADRTEQQPANLQPKWEKVLYKRQNPPFSDNHTDERQFLAQLRTNVNVVRYSPLEAIRGGAIVVSQLDFVVIYLAIFQFTQLDHWGLPALLYANSLLALLCCTLFLMTNTILGGQPSDKWWRTEHWRTLLTVLAFGYGFTPVIRTLTTSISTDTIWASAILLFMASLVVHDYGMEGAPIASATLSLNLCLASSVFLISRVQSDPLAFALLALSLLLFCFWPLLRNVLLARAPSLIFFLLFPLAFGSISMLAWLDMPFIAIAHFMLHIFLVGFCPLLLVRMQQMKSTIHGPWDEATLKASIH